MKKKFLSLLALLMIFGTTSFAQTTNNYGLPEKIEEGNILHCFNWSINEVRANLQNIANAGFGAVQLSPMQRPSAKKGDAWNDLYRPYDLSFQASDAMGSVEDLKSLCEEARSYGIKVIVDVVANHVDKENGYHLPWWDEGSQPRLRPNPDPTINYSDRISITTGLIGDYAGEINSEAQAVLQKAQNYVKNLQGYGVSGIRWDAAKHIGLPSEGSNFWETVTSAADGMFHYGEILDNPCNSNYGALVREYGDYMAVTDTYFSNESAKRNNGIPMRKNGEYAPLVGKGKLVYWAESHDTYSNTPQFGGWSNNVDQSVINRAYAAVACRDGAVALYLARPGTTGFNNIKLGKSSSEEQDNNGYRSSVVTEINKFRNLMSGREEYFTKSEDGKAVCIARNNGGAVIITEPNATFIVPNGGGYCPVVANTNGRLKDKISGNNITVTAENITGQAGETGVVIIYTTSTRPKNDVEIQDFESSEITIYYDNSETEWDDVYCYYWGGASGTDFPGPKMTKIPSDGYRDNLYAITLPLGSHALFSAGSRNVQTVNSDGTVEANHVYRGLSELDGGKNKLRDMGIFGEEPEEESASGITIYYDNSLTQYPEVCCHFWGGESTSSFPGMPMTKVKEDIYSYLLPNGTTGILFAAKDRSGQTVNITTNIIDGYIFKGLAELSSSKNMVSAGEPYNPEEEADPEPELKSLTIFYDNSITKYDPVACYYWGGETAGPKFPGTLMTPVEGDIYMMEVPLGSSVIFSNNNNGRQTVNVTNIEHLHIYQGQEVAEGKNPVVDNGEYHYVPSKSAITVYVNSAEVPYLYAWDSNGTAINGDFPGISMDSDPIVNKGENQYFSHTFEEYESINIILSYGHGSHKTADIVNIESDIYLAYSGGVEYAIIEDPESEIPSVGGPQMITIYFDDINTAYHETGILDKVYCHYFADHLVSTQWPGIEMTLVESLISDYSMNKVVATDYPNLLYKAEVPLGSTVIFNAGPGSVQTQDVTDLEHGRIYIGQSQNDENGNNLVYPGDWITEYPDISTGIANNKIDYQITFGSNIVNFSNMNGQTVIVCALDGKTIYAGDVNSSLNLSLEKGFYLIRVNKDVKKIYVE